MKQLSGWLRFGLLTMGACCAAVGQTPAINAGGIIDAADFAVGRPVSAGNIVAIFGTNLAAQVVATDTVTLSTTLGNVSVTFNGINAALQFVAPTQINAQIPWNVLSAGVNGTVNVVVTSRGSSSAAEPVTINQFGPGVYQASGHAFAINIQDATSARWASFAAPLNVFGAGGYPAFPAKVGDALLVYAGGLGAVDQAIATGQPGAGARTTTQPVVLVNNVPAQISYSGLSSYVGVYQVNMTVPQVAAGNALPLQIQIGGLTTTATTNIAVE